MSSPNINAVANRTPDPEQQWKVATLPQRKSTLRSLLEDNKSAMEAALPRHVSVDRLVKVFFTSVTSTPKLLECSRASLLSSLLRCAQLGLEPNTYGGEAYLIPYGELAQLIVGYRGMMKLARQSGQVASIEAHVVYAGDTFEYQLGTDPKLIHHPKLDGERGAVRLFYGIARLKDGSLPIVEVMTKEEVDAIRKRSKASGSGPWVTDYNEMGRKTVVRRLCKYVPQSIELQTALMLDDQANDGKPQQADLGALSSMGFTDDAAALEQIQTNHDANGSTDEAASLVSSVNAQQQSMAV